MKPPIKSLADTDLGIALSAAVPLRLMAMEMQGGPSSADYERARKASAVFGSEGDKLLFRSKKQGDTARVFNVLSHAVAVLAFCPGGIHIFGQHFEAAVKADDFPTDLLLNPPFNNWRQTTEN